MENYSEETSARAQRAAHYQAADINDKLIINMRDLNHILHYLYEGKASQKRILIILGEVKSITQRDLTMRLGIQPGSASEILSKLENAGLIMRTESETDRRTTNVSLTDKGAQMAQEAAGQRRQRHMEMFSCLSESEKNEMLLLLERINKDWTQRYQPDQAEHRHKHHPHRHEGRRMEMEENRYGEVH